MDAELLAGIGATKIISVYSPVGGSTKTTMVTNLAIGYMREGRHVGVIDMSSQCDLTQLLYARNRNLNFQTYMTEMWESGDLMSRGKKRKLFGGHPRDGTNVDPNAADAAAVVVIPRRSLVEITQSIDIIYQGTLASLDTAPELGVKIEDQFKNPENRKDRSSGGSIRLITGSHFTFRLNDGLVGDLALKERHGRYATLLSNIIAAFIKKHKLDVVILDCPKEDNALTRSALAISKHLVFPLPTTRDPTMPIESLCYTLSQMCEEVEKPALAIITLVSVLATEEQMVIEDAHREAVPKLLADKFKEPLPYYHVKVHETPLTIDQSVPDFMSYGQSYFDYDLDDPLRTNFELLMEKIFPSAV